MHINDSAARRARRRGVDTMEITPRRLATARRLGNTPAKVIRESWETVLQAIDDSAQTLRR
ncbi:hypothetical protein [Corynebacterium guangdongense]|uniref:Uncharacterized protein n=1 Tax=Corynebacterium guangdongense TaxID=1783348 RepID=A0ABU1ZUY9_9CORY|nr:hypothetical protein [Corynebacterium guangdongense]MDR7328741.1 hypothetical protein [Corynebacterium guangdongense]WJZ17317.1 hypothetical protein CGUA_03610 [Corynebacterium guangdongense]